MSITTTPTVCQGFQSCLEPLLLMPHLVPPKPTIIFDSNAALSAAVALPEKNDIHPSSNYSLSTKSLEMCTESLGSETGSAATDEEFPLHNAVIQNCGGAKKAAAKAIKKVKRGREINFPPPLKSISGSEGVRVQTQREDGRLVMKAFTVSSCSCCHFQAERGGGRLRLSLVRDGCGDAEEEGDRDGGRVGCGGEWSSSRCSGDRNSRERMQSLPFCVAIS